MKTFLLLMTIMTAEDYKRGFGDGIAASKSASAAIHTQTFHLKKDCEKVKDAFLNSPAFKVARYDARTMKKLNGFEMRQGVSAECIELSVK